MLFHMLNNEKSLLNFSISELLKTTINAINKKVNNVNIMCSQLKIVENRIAVVNLYIVQ